MKNFCDVGTLVLHLLTYLSVKNTYGSADTKMRYWLQNEPRWREVSTKQVWRVIIIPETRWWDPFNRSPRGLMSESLHHLICLNFFLFQTTCSLGHFYCHSCWQDGHTRTEGASGPGIGSQREQRPLQHESSTWSYPPVLPWQRLLWPQHSSVPCLAFPSNSKSDVLVARVLWPTHFHMFLCGVQGSWPASVSCPGLTPRLADSAAGVCCSCKATNKRQVFPMHLLIF